MAHSRFKPLVLCRTGGDSSFKKLLLSLTDDIDSIAGEHR
jgi:hypothetical protein